MPVKQLVWNGSKWHGAGSNDSGSGPVAPEDAPNPLAPFMVFPPSTPDISLYRPISYATTTELRANLSIPADANLVMWPHATAQENDLWSVLQTLGVNDILVLPEAPLPYLVDTSQGFASTNGRWMEMARAKRGIVGMGPGTRIELSQSSFTQGKQPESAGGTQEQVIGCWTAGGYFGNFEMRGRDLGGVAYNALGHKADDSVWERIYANGAHRGFRNSPGGESGAFTGYQGDRQKILNCEVDCRDLTGARVGSSPWMFNRQNDIEVHDSYGHHANAGMPTCWRVNNGTFIRVRSEFNGMGVSGGTNDYDGKSWGLSGTCFNFELCSGTFLLEDCVFIANFRNNYDPAQEVVLGGSSSPHMSVGTNEASAVYEVINPVFDYASDGPGRVGGWRFDIHHHPTYLGDPSGQSESGYRVRDQYGVVIQHKVRY